MELLKNSLLDLITETSTNLPPDVRAASARAGGGTEVGPAQAGGTVAEAEKQLILRALRENGGNRSAAARQIGVSRRTLHRKLHRYQIEDTK